jgi:hypothetical protein
MAGRLLPRSFVLALKRRTMRPLLVIATVAFLLLVPATSIGAPTAHTAAAPVTWESDYFQSPSGNILCRYFYEGNPLMACMTLNDGAMGGVRLCCRRGFLRRWTNRPFLRGPVLRYGDSWRVPGEFRCDSSFNGMRCRSLQSGHGFFINRDNWSRF